MAICVHRAYVQMGYMYWRRQTAHASDRSRSSSVTVSVCTVTRLPKLERLPRVPTNGKGAVPAARTYAVSFAAKIWNLPRNRRMPTNRMKAVPVHSCRQNWHILLRNGADACTWWVHMVVKCTSHGGMGSPSRLQAPCKLIVVGSKKGVWLKWRNWLPFPPHCDHHGVKGHILLSTKVWMICSVLPM